MHQDFTHYLITRYNVPLRNWAQDKAGNLVRHEAWMHQRLSLFKKFCVPTINGQSSQHFQWLIYLGSGTNARHIEAIKEALGEIKNAELRLADDMEGLLTDLRHILSKSKTDFVITSRLDNDDGLGKDFIRNVQKAFLHQHRLLINMDHGVVYDTGKKILTELRRAYLNHFTSLIERRTDQGDYLTVLGFAHTQPPPDVVVLNLHTKYAWLKIIHDRNLNSRTKGRPVSKNQISPYYNLAKKDIPVSMIQTAIYFVRKGVGRIFKMTGRKND